MISTTGPSPSSVRNSNLFVCHAVLSLRSAPSDAEQKPPRHRNRNPRRVFRSPGLAVIRFRSPLLTEYLFLQVLRCFTSLRTPRANKRGAAP